ncbi:histidine ammonia-lyase [Mangrovibacterium lignilyticum]|uniref:histidine ammonia-lyase n=1 Tax=Mangrovibacterium lignilyticum TaxID=2668052 RepID=UPI0013D5BD97|nr:histidine ammonia-lyase [Mangrovibacterium lignilyticum]
MSQEVFHYGEDFLTASKALALSCGELKGELSKTAREGIRKCQQIVEDITESDQAVYGINTGFGPLCTTRVSAADTKKLQENILKSHAVGTGDPIPTSIAALMLVLKVHALAKGFSGIQEATIDRIIWHIDQAAIPVVPKQGSVGASGDLAPLSHLFLPLIGYGKLDYKGKRRDAETVLSELNQEPLKLNGKEGLALINGTQFMAAHAVTAVIKMQNLIASADLIGAMMIEGLTGSARPFLPQLHKIRPFKGNRHTAETVTNLLTNSEVVQSHAGCTRVQDPYSLRCMPQVHGASWNAWLHLKETVEIEINSVTDNPIVFDDGSTISGGNFHGQPIALPMDYACLAASEIGNISDRRIYLSLMGNYPGVPKLLLKETGLNSGFMIVQYTSAALASENKSLCYPASADSIPTSMGQEDHVSMGSISGRKLLTVIDNVERVLGLELFCAAQALDFHAPLRPTPILDGLQKHIRKQIPHITEDELINDYMHHAINFVKNADLVKLAKEISAISGAPYRTTLSNLFDEF